MFTRWKSQSNLGLEVEPLEDVFLILLLWSDVAIGDLLLSPFLEARDRRIEDSIPISMGCLIHELPVAAKPTALGLHHVEGQSLSCALPIIGSELSEESVLAIRSVGDPLPIPVVLAVMMMESVFRCS